MESLACTSYAILLVILMFDKTHNFPLSPQEKLGFIGLVVFSWEEWNILISEIHFLSIAKIIL
jgi:hypothetical protein